jgi:hypothetical protein
VIFASFHYCFHYTTAYYISYFLFSRLHTIIAVSLISRMLQCSHSPVFHSNICIDIYFTFGLVGYPPSLDTCLVRLRPIMIPYVSCRPCLSVDAIDSIDSSLPQRHEAPEPNVSTHCLPISPNIECVLCIFIEYRTNGLSRKEVLYKGRCTWTGSSQPTLL